jgi:hypothetical protein
MGHGRGAGLLYHAEYPERFWQRLSKGRPSDDWQRHQMSSLTFIVEEPFLFSGLYHICIMFASCVASAHGGGESLICVSYIGISWEPGRRLWQLLRSCGGEYGTAYRGLVRVGRASGGVWLVVARWMGGSEVEDGRLPSWEGMGWSEKLSRLVCRRGPRPRPPTLRCPISASSRHRPAILTSRQEHQRELVVRGRTQLRLFCLLQSAVKICLPPSAPDLNRRRL